MKADLAASNKKRPGRKSDKKRHRRKSPMPSDDLPVNRLLKLTYTYFFVPDGLDKSKLKLPVDNYVLEFCNIYGKCQKLDL